MKNDRIKKLAEQSVKKWRNRLGFYSWKIDVKITSFRRKDNFPQDGDIVINYPKKKATILLGTILKSPVEEIIVHELVHLMLWPLDQKKMSAIKRLPKEEQKRMKNDFLGKLEKVVGRTAKALLYAQNNY